MPEERRVLAIETVEIRHPAFAELERYAETVGVKLDDSPEDLWPDDPERDFLIWGSDPVVFFNEETIEAGHGCRAWVEEYGRTGVKYGGQHDAEEFARCKARQDYVAQHEYETGRTPTPAQVDQAVGP